MKILSYMGSFFLLAVVMMSLVGESDSALSSAGVNKGSIVVAGNFSIGGRPLNLAQYDISTGE